MNKTLLTLCLAVLSQVASGQLDFSKVNTIEHPLLTKMDSAITAGQYGSITSVVFAKDGNVIFEKYYNDKNIDSKHNTRSVTKTMGSILTGIAIKEGKIGSEKDKIFDYLKDELPVAHPNPRKMEITLEDLLTMSSCLECNDFNSFSRGHEERMYIIEDWTKFFLDLPVRSYPFEPKPEDQPYGRAFSYCSAGAALTAEILQRAVGQKLDAFAAEHLFDPLGIEDYTLHYSPEGTLNTAGGSEYRSRDLLKLIQMCLNDGQWNGKEILSKDWIQKASTPKAKVQDGFEYGCFFWLHAFGGEKKYPAFYMSGNGGQKILAMPELKLTAVITTTNYGMRQAHPYTNDLMDMYIVPAME